MIKEHGIRNSLLLAPMPTASTAQILGNNEGIEAYTSNIYSRRVLSGEFQVVNPHLLRDLTERDLWDDEIPDEIKALYKTVWEVSQKTILNMAADRGAFIDQSQSLNIHVAEPNYGKLTSMHFYGWKLGLKTGMYYLRTKAAAAAIQFTVDKSKAAATAKNGASGDDDKVIVDKKEDTNGAAKEVAALEQNMAAMVCSLQNKDDCLMC